LVRMIVAQKSEELTAVFAPILCHNSNTPWPTQTRWSSQDHCSLLFWSIGSWWNGFVGYSWVIWSLVGRIVAQKSEELTCFCPLKSWPQIQHSMTNLQTRWSSQDHCSSLFFWSIGSWWNGFEGYSWVIWPLVGRIVAQKSEELTAVFVSSLGHKSNTPWPTPDQMTV
jgi:hypothetical protein